MVRNIEKIYDSHDNLVALVFNLKDVNNHKEGIHMFTPNDWGVQIGLGKYPKLYRVPPHIHVRARNKTTVGTEILIVLKGKIRVDLYDGKQFIRTIELGEDMGIVMKCGHGVEFLEDSLIIEIKEGPYPGPDKDKVWI